MHGTKHFPRIKYLTVFTSYLEYDCKVFCVTANVYMTHTSGRWHHQLPFLWPKLSLSYCVYL